MIGAAELLPLAAGSLYGGALADRFDRRKLLLACQLALVAVAVGLTVAAATGPPPIWILYVLAGLTAGASAVERVVRASIVPNTVSPEHLRSALSLTYGLYQVTQVIGPGVGGLLIAAFGIATPYGIDAVSCLGMAAAAAALSPQPPHHVEHHEPVGKSIREGLRFVGRLKALMASFIIDLSAMTFGMPRALFAVLSLSVYHAGASGTGLLYASVAAGSTVAALTTGWLTDARFLGRIVLGAVAAWGLFIAGAGLVGSIWIAAALFAFAGAADSVSAVCRSTISQTLTPDRLRGRMTSVFSLVVAGGPRLGDVESGSVAALTSPAFSVVSGGLICFASVGVIAVAFPELAAYDGDAVGAGELASEAAEEERELEATVDIP